MTTAYLKRDLMINLRSWRAHFPAWVLFFVNLFALKMVGLSNLASFFLFFFIIIFSLKDVFDEDQAFGFLSMLICEKRSLIPYVIAKTLVALWLTVGPFSLMTWVFTHNVALALGGLMITPLAILGASFNVSGRASWILQLVLVPFLIPLFLILNLQDAGVLNTLTTLWIFTGMTFIYMPLGVIFSTLCLKVEGP